MNARVSAEAGSAQAGRAEAGRGAAERAATAVHGRRAAALGVMLASGFAGLGYQLVWTQQSALWLGHEAAALLPFMDDAGTPDAPARQGEEK